MTLRDSDAEQILQRAEMGDADARQQLLVLHRERLRQMIAVRMDRRLAVRIDPSDVVQEALIDAVDQLPDYLRQRPLPFYPWLRQLAWKRLVELQRRHMQIRKRSVLREERWTPPLPDESAVALADRLVGLGSSPSVRMRREELRSLIQTALGQLSENDREVLVLRHLEQLPPAEIAAVLGISSAAVHTRHLRALERLRGLFGDELAKELP